jgi:4-amino-4-deoxy-L-arabinose transferase-like glycosyltransferase
LLYGARLTTLPIRGEETRRAQVACEMVQTGDWIVPRQQGLPLLSRPPLGSYPIAIAAILLGDCSLLAVRLPTLLATWLTVLLIYGYGRLFLSRLGALTAGLAYGTMGQVLVLGRLAETEATFTFLLSGALLVWHWGYCRGASGRWGRLWPWLAGYGLAALATLAKGPQAPVYFAAPVCLFLVWRRDWRTLLSRSHLLGVALFAALVGAWQIPFWMQMGWPAVKTIWLGDVAMRFEDVRWQTIALHLLVYPVEIAVCTLPWSPLLIGYLVKGFRRSLADAKPYAVFLGFAIGLAFFTCWVVPGAKGRYFMPLYPCLALLIGLSVERAAEPAAAAWQRRGWQVFLLSKAALALVAGLGVAAVAWGHRLQWFQWLEWTQPGWFVAVYVVGASIAVVLLMATHANFRPTHVRTALLTVTALIGLSYVGVVINGMVGASEDPAFDVAQLKRKLPLDARLVSFGLVETLFTYLYREPIEERPWPKSASELGPTHDYFCFTWDRPVPPPLPFGWQIEGVIPCDRVRHDPPVKKVIESIRWQTVRNEPARDPLATAACGVVFIGR